MTKISNTPRGLKSQEHIDRILHKLEVYIAHYRVPQPQQLREATDQLIAGNLGPRNAFYYDIQNEIYWLIYRQVEYLINLEQQEQVQQNQQQVKEKQEPTPRQKYTPKSKISLHYTPNTPIASVVLTFLSALKTQKTLNTLSHPPP